MRSKGCGTGLLVIIALIVLGATAILTNPIFWVILALGGVFFFVVRRNIGKENQSKLSAGLTAGASLLENIANGSVPELNSGFSTKQGEKLIFAMDDVVLTEYQSTGSSYSGTSLGVSFPLFGRIRGNVGGQGGEITKNPEQLMGVDEGRAVFTDQRIVFTGAKLVREWDLDKILELAPGPNGYNVKIAVSNRERTSGLQAKTMFDLGPGLVAGYVYTLHGEGEAAAKAWVADVAKRMREGAATGGALEG
ncbi:MAG: hypothetical protein RL545_777 [Actinomycetota bacterium]